MAVTPLPFSAFHGGPYAVAIHGPEPAGSGPVTAAWQGGFPAPANSTTGEITTMNAPAASSQGIFQEAVEVGVVHVLRRPRRWPNVTADLDTRAGELYAPMGKVLPFKRRGGDGALREDRVAGRERSEPAADGFASSREQFESLISFMDGTDAAGIDLAGLVSLIVRDRRELLRRLLDDHLALRAVREQRLAQVVGDDEVARGRVEPDHRRVLGTVFGKVTVSRMAYRAPTHSNLYPADAALNLPV